MSSMAPKNRCSTVPGWSSNSHSHPHTNCGYSRSGIPAKHRRAYRHTTSPGDAFLSSQPLSSSGPYAQVFLAPTGQNLALEGEPALGFTCDQQILRIHARGPSGECGCTEIIELLAQHFADSEVVLIRYAELDKNQCEVTVIIRSSVTSDLSVRIPDIQPRRQEVEIDSSLAMLQILGSGISKDARIICEVTQLLNQWGIEVHELITNETTIGYVVDTNHAGRAIDLLRRTFEARQAA